jgi:hypothetical protein
MPFMHCVASEKCAHVTNAPKPEFFGAANAGNSMLERASIKRLRWYDVLLPTTMPDQRSCTDAPASQMRKKIYQYQKASRNAQQPRNEVFAHLGFSFD